MTGQFTAYEFIAIIIPGILVALVGMWLFPPARRLFWHGDKVSFGGASLLVIIAFVIGLLTHEASGLFATHVLRPMGELPTQRVLQKKEQKIIAESQKQRLRTEVLKQFKVDMNKVEPGQWYYVVREMYVRVRNANRAERVDIFLRNINLFRSLLMIAVLLGVAALARAACILFSRQERRSQAALFAFAGYASGGVALLLLAWMTYFSMESYGEFYARELFLTFLSLPPR